MHDNDESAYSSSKAPLPLPALTLRSWWVGVIVRAGLDRAQHHICYLSICSCLGTGTKLPPSAINSFACRCHWRMGHCTLGRLQHGCCTCAIAFADFGSGHAPSGSGDERRQRGDGGWPGRHGRGAVRRGTALLQHRRAGICLCCDCASALASGTVHVMFACVMCACVMCACVRVWFQARYCIYGHVHGCVSIAPMYTCVRCVYECIFLPRGRLR